MIFAIVLAGGSGSRLAGSPTPKQYLTIGGLTLLERVTATFLRHPLVDQLIVAVPKADLEKATHLFAKATKPITIIPGGASRQASSKAAVFSLRNIADPDDIVLIHDAARVLVSADIITRAVNALQQTDAATAAVPAQDTLMQVQPSGFIDRIIDRSSIVMAQTPQAFRYRVIQSAHEHAAEETATDDISLVLGIMPVTYFPGSTTNFKLTTRDDLKLLKALIEKEPNP